MVAISKAWTSIADGATDPDSPLDTSLITALRDNSIHNREWIGASFFGGAIQDHDHDGANSKVLGAGAVNVASLKTATGTVSFTGGTTHPPDWEGSEVTLPGGQHGFWPRIKQANGSPSAFHAGFVCGTRTVIDENAFITKTNLEVLETHNTFFNSATAEQTYIISSPPYDLGDGEIPLFVFVEVRPDGRIRMTYVAPDPPWANNGPTLLRTDFVDDNGKAFRLVLPSERDRLLKPHPPRPASVGEHGHRITGQQLLSEQLLDGAKEEPVPIAIDLLKNRDMPLIPHPFNPEPGNTVVLLDPVGALMEKFLELHNAHIEDESVVDLLLADHLVIGNSELPLKGPPGVAVVSVKRKLST